MRRKTHLSINHICFFLGLVLWMAAIGSSIAVLLMTGNVAATLCVLGFGVFAFGCGVLFVRIVRKKLVLFSDQFCELLDVPTSGKVFVDGTELSKLNEEQLTIFRRRKIGFVFQNYNLVPVLNVYENIALPVELDGGKVDKNFLEEVVGFLGLKEKLNSMPNNLSGGQQQRVAIARALIARPTIVLADEPTGNLDSKTSMDVLGLMKTSSYKFKQTLVMITHNDEIAQLADRIIHIEDGKIVQ